MKILILGASGRLGNAFMRQCANETLLTPNRTELDVFDREALDAYIKKIQPQWIVNLISYNAVDKAQTDDRDLAFRVNAELPKLLTEAVTETNIPLIQVSTDYVFPGERKDGYDESDVPRPVNVYGESKLAGENAALAAHPRTYVVRTSRLYGQMAKSDNAKKSFIDHIIADCKRYRSFGVNMKEVASPTLVDDVASHIYRHIIQTAPTPGVYHVVNSGGATLYEWASEIIKQLELPNTIWKKDPAGFNRPALRPNFNMLRSTKIPEMRNWKEALAEFLATQQHLKTEVIAANPANDEPKP